MTAVEETGMALARLLRQALQTRLATRLAGQRQQADAMARQVGPPVDGALRERQDGPSGQPVAASGGDGR